VECLEDRTLLTTFTDIVVGKNVGDLLEVFVSATDVPGSSTDVVYSNTQGAIEGPWRGWNPLGGPAGVNVDFDTIVVGTNANGGLALFGTDTAILPLGNPPVYMNQQQTPGGLWVGWSSLGLTGAGTDSSIEALRVARNAAPLDTLQVFAGTVEAFAKNQVYSTTQTAPNATTYGAFGTLGVPTVNLRLRGVEMNVTGTGSYLEAFAIGSDDNVYSKSQFVGGAGWGAWGSFGGLPGGQSIYDLRVIPDANSRLQLFAHHRPASGPDVVWTSWQLTAGGAWSPWALLNAPTNTLNQIEAAKNLAGNLEVFAAWDRQPNLLQHAVASSGE
jgi:hypothetical protein